MKKLILWLCVALPLISSAQITSTIFKLDLNEAIQSGSIELPIEEVTISGNFTSWQQVQMFPVGNDKWERQFFIANNQEIFYKFEVKSVSGQVYTESTAPCLQAFTGQGLVRKIIVPEDIPEGGIVEFCWESCEACPAPPCDGGLTSTNAYQECLPGGQALIVFEWETNCSPEFVLYSNAQVGGASQYPVDINSTNFGVYAGNGQMPPNWSVEHQLVVQFTDGTQSDPILFTPESCIEGCTDPTQKSYNPWATIDDGSCSGSTCNQELYHQITMQITLDNWPNETSWSITSGGLGIIGEAPVGTYNFNDVGKTFTYQFCTDINAGFEFIINDAYGDGLAGTTSGGTLDGSVKISNCNEEIIWELSDPDFGTVAYSGQQFGIECEGEEEIFGCTDPNYQSYNPEATVDDGSCTEPHIVGCMDENSINYNPDATKQELIPVCDYNLIVRDAASDGWGNSWIGVAQGGIPIGTYTLGPGIEQQEFPISLSSAEEVVVYYFEVGGPQSPPEEIAFQTLQNSFTIIDSDGEILLEGGTNPFEDNGQGALQNFAAPFFDCHVAQPNCGDICIPIVEGCTNPDSLNYNPDANVDDGSCIPIIEGCMNPLAFNYNPDATVDDGSCIPVIVGCMDPTAFNYNPEANTPGDCIPVVEGCMDPTSFNYNENANVDDGSCIPVVEGCMDVNSINYNPDANVDDGSCIPIIEGCMDPTAFNYNPEANVDDGSCEPIVYGCMDPESFNYNPDANVDNGTCEPVVFGCTDPEAFNYNPDANTDNGTCIPVILGCTDNTSFNYNPDANTDDGSCIPILTGCTDPDAYNYNPLANTDDGSCIPVIFGCTDNTALNYNPLANTDDGSCIPILYGCMDPESFNYNPLATVDDGSCIPIIEGCTDPNALNYNPDANTEDFSCIEIVYGCMDPDSVNYNPEANVDNGTCITAVVGCMDPESYNFNPEANVPDPDACLYDAGCIDGPGEPYWLNNQCYAWVIDVDNYCCDNEWDPVCAEMYNYCENGFPEGVNLNSLFNRSFNNIVVYPNPTNDVLNIASNLDITYSLYDVTGKVIVKDSNNKELNISKLSPGTYILNIKYQGQIFNKKIIKE